jgi:hypothetical protein
MDVRRVPMHTRKLARIALLAVVAAAVAFSCSLDYMLDFEILDVTPGPGPNDVTVDYWLHNAGSKIMYDATIHILVYSNGIAQFELPTPGIDLSLGETITDTLTFTLGSTPVTPSAVVVGAGWNDENDF